MNHRPEILMMSPLFQPTSRVLEERYVCHHLWEQTDPAHALSQLADRIEAMTSLAGAARVDRATIQALPRLKLIANFGVGVDGIDLQACRDHGVTVCNTPDVLTEDVADFALGLLLATIRQIPQGDRYVRQGQWLTANMALTQTLQRRRVGIVGLGRIGQAIARRCAAFNTELAYFGPRHKPDMPYQYFDDLVAMSQWADVLIAACPGGPGTRHLISRPVLSALGPQGVFINIARGSVVDQEALVELLGSGELGSAGLDVFDDEPRVPQALIALPHIVLQPHQASASVATRTAMGQLVIDNLAAHFAGQAYLTPVG